MLLILSNKQLPYHTILKDCDVSDQIVNILEMRFKVLYQVQLNSNNIA